MTGEVAQSIYGLGGMRLVFPDTWNGYALWQITAVFSGARAIMNLLSIQRVHYGEGY